MDNENALERTTVCWVDDAGGGHTSARALGVRLRVGLRSRIIGRVGNEVWSITALSGEDLILRVSRSNTFAAELWATDQARRMNVSVPEILLVDKAVPTKWRA